MNDGATESAILKALDDAVADGMDVINISLGSNVAPLPANDPEVTAIEHASALGVIVVVASGNNGPDPATVASPATAPSAIAVGASDNDRVFAASASLSNGGTYVGHSRRQFDVGLGDHRAHGGRGRRSMATAWRARRCPPAA